VFLGWVGLVAGIASVVNVSGTETTVSIFATASFVPTLVFATVFRIWAGYGFWRTEARTSCIGPPNVGRNHSKPGGATVSYFSPNEIEYLGSGLLDHRRGEVAHPYVLYASLPLQLSHCAQGLLEWHARVWPVHEQQIDVLGLELLKALAGRAEDVVVGEAAGTHLGDEIDCLALYARVPDAASDLALVGVHLGGVYVPVSQSECALNDLIALLAGEPPGAQT
jgi:hypothetical protein